MKFFLWLLSLRYMFSLLFVSILALTSHAYATSVELQKAGYGWSVESYFYDTLNDKIVDTSYNWCSIPDYSSAYYQINEDRYIDINNARFTDSHYGTTGFGKQFVDSKSETLVPSPEEGADFYDLISSSLLFETIGYSDIFTEMDSFEISLDIKSSFTHVPVNPSDKSHNSVVVSLVDKTASSTINSFQVDIFGDGSLSDYKATFLGLDTSHSYYYSIQSSSYMYMDHQLPDKSNRGGIESLVNINYASPVPEPSTLILFGVGILGFTFSRRVFKTGNT